MPFSFEKKIGAGLALAVLMVAVGVIPFASTQRMVSDAERVNHTLEVVAAIEKLLAVVGHEGVSFRGYVITGDEVFLKGHPQALADTETTFDKLRGLLTDNPEQEKRLAALTPRVGERMKLAETLIELRKGEGFKATDEQAMTRRGEQTLDEIYRLAAEMSAQEMALLKERELRSKASARTTQELIVLGRVLAFSLVGGALWLLAREFESRRAGEAALRASEERLRRAADAAELGVWTWEPAGDRVRWENMWPYEILGMARTEAPLTAARFAADFVHPEDLAAFERAIGATVQTGARFFYQGRFRRPDGVQCWVEFTGQPVQGPDGTCLRVLGTIQDITARKQAEQALRESEQEFRSLAEAVPQIVWATRPDGWNIYFNQKWVDYTGLTLEESHGHGWNTPFHPDDQQRAWEAWQRAVQHNEPYSLECRLRRADGVYRWWLIRGVPMRSANGEIQKWFGTCTDIEDLKQAGAALRQGEARFRSIFHDASVPTAVSLPPDGRYVQVNRAVCELLGYSEEELLAMTIEAVTHPEDRAGLALEPLRNLVNGEIATFRAEKRYLRKDGEVVWADTSVSLVRDEEKQPLYFIAQIQDITGRKRTEAALRESQDVLELAIKVGNFGIWDWDLVTGKTVWSERCKEISGLPRDAEMSDAVAFGTVHPDDLARVQAGLALALESNLDSEAEYRTVWPDGTVRWVRVRGRALDDATGKPVRVTGITHDITGRKQAEEALLKSQELLELAVEAGRIGIWKWDLVADKMVWSERCNLIFGLPRDTEASFAVSLTAVHPDDRAAAEASVKLGLETKVNTELEYRTVWPEGTVRWVHSRGRVFDDAAGKPFRFTGIMLDVTERKESEEALRRFNAELEALVRERTEVIEIAMRELREEIAERRRLEEEILGIGERAQARIGQDLHDDLGQQLAGLAMLAQLLSDQLSAESHPKAADAARLKTFLTESISTARNLAKSLYPVELERGGLMLALHDLAHRTELLAGIVCQVRAEDAFRFEKAAEIHLYRIVQESIGNALKHGNARNIAIGCTARDGASTLTVTDDGSGFERPEEGKWAGMGLHLFQYRARLIGAAVTVARGENGGCQVSCSMGISKATQTRALRGDSTRASLPS